MRAAYGFTRIALWLVLVTTPARAERPRAPESAARDAFWRTFTQPAQARSHELVRQGRALLSPALGSSLLMGADASLQRQLAVQSALSRFEGAVQLTPNDREARFYYATALSSWEGRGEDRSSEAIAQLEALRALDPQYQAQEVAFQLGVLHTHRGEFARAVTEYRRSLALRSDDDTDSALLGNLAEVTMLTDDLPSALALYERAAHETAGSARVLALWGAAVALDRLGEHTAALERARRALEEDHAPFAALHQSGVFFEPAYERFYYEGLGSLAMVERERAPAESLNGLILRGRAWLAHPDDVAAIVDLERALTDLEQAGREIPSLKSALARARARLPAQHGPVRSTQADLPSSRDARALVGMMRAAASFATYLQRDGGKGLFEEDAARHLETILRALSDR